MLSILLNWNHVQNLIPLKYLNHTVISRFIYFFCTKQQLNEFSLLCPTDEKLIFMKYLTDAENLWAYRKKSVQRASLQKFKVLYSLTKKKSNTKKIKLRMKNGF